MPLRVRIVVQSLVLLLIAGAVAPISAYAWPLGKALHLNPSSTKAQDSRITVEVYNHAHLFREVQVDGRVYTVMPNERLVIKAPAGTPVYAASRGFTHRKGDLLFTVTPETKGRTIAID